MQLMEESPPTTRTWITPSEFAKLLGMSTCTVQNLLRSGAFREESRRPRGGRDYEFNKSLAMLDAERARAANVERDAS